ncbi:hypothetical protein [Methylobacterium sp. CM6247]
MNIVQRAKAHALVAALRLKSTDLEVFEALQSIAQSDGAFVAKQTVPALLTSPASRETEDVIERALEGYIRDRTQGFRRDGADPSATTAYGLAFLMAFHSASDEAVAHATWAQGKTPSGLPAQCARRAECRACEQCSAFS